MSHGVTTQYRSGLPGGPATTQALNEALHRAWALYESSDTNASDLHQAIIVLQDASRLRLELHSLNPTTTVVSTSSPPVEKPQLQLTISELELVRNLIEKALPESSRTEYRHLVSVLQAVREALGYDR